MPSPFGANANASSSNSSSVSSSRSAARSDEWWPCITSGAVRLRRDALCVREPPDPAFICGKSTGAVGVGRGSAAVNIAAVGRARLKIVHALRVSSWGLVRGAKVDVPRSVGRLGHAQLSLGANDGLDLLERVDRKESLLSESVKMAENRASVGVGRRARRAGQPPSRGLRVSSSRFRRCRCSRKPWKQKRTVPGRAFARGRAELSNAHSRDTRA